MASPLDAEYWKPFQGLAAFAAEVLLMALALGLAAIVADRRAPPQHLPWTPLSANQPIGLFTRAKLEKSSGEDCRATLQRSGVSFSEAPDRTEGGFCEIRDAVRVTGALRPGGVVMTCRQALAVTIWERQVAGPAVQRTLGEGLAAVEHYGSYACRRTYGRDVGRISEHASANALDVAALVLEDGRRVSVLRDWNDLGPRGQAIRAARDGACDLFKVTLSPDYNEAHRDHLHLDMGGFRICR